jgi:hypothetical protein
LIQDPYDYQEAYTKDIVRPLVRVSDAELIKDPYNYEEGWIVTRAFVFKKSFIETLNHFEPVLNDSFGYNFEHAVYQASVLTKKKGGFVADFIESPHCNGYLGFDNSEPNMFHNPAIFKTL